MALRSTTALVAAALASSLAVAPLGALAAESQAPQQAQSQQQAQSKSFSDQKLEAYAEAAIQVSALLQEWRPKMQQARQDGNQEQLKQMRQKANSELVSAIKAANGINLQEYQEISEAARQDKALYDKLNKMVQEKQKN